MIEIDDEKDKNTYPKLCNSCELSPRADIFFLLVVLYFFFVLFAEEGNLLQKLGTFCHIQVLFIDIIIEVRVFER